MFEGWSPLEKFFHEKKNNFFETRKYFPTSEKNLKEQEKFNFVGKDLMN